MNEDPQILPGEVISQIARITVARAINLRQSEMDDDTMESIAHLALLAANRTEPAPTANAPLGEPFENFARNGDSTPWKSADESMHR